MSDTPVSQPVAADADPTARFRVGTLQYTRATLPLLLFWLLEGGFAFTLMSSAVPSVLPLCLKALGASNFAMALILSTIPMVVNIMTNPVVSFRSDRFRSRWGRRIPLLVVATPLLCLTLIGMGFAPELGALLHRTVVGKLLSVAPLVTILVVIGVLMVAFKICECIVNPMFWYLLNDVVPQAFMARFMVLYRMVATGAGALFSYFVFKHAETHMRAIFVGAGLLLVAAFALMCWNIKEGEYPPPPPNVGKRTGLVAAARTYVQECACHRVYWYFFLYNMFLGVSGACGSFSVFQSQSLGLSLAQIGTIGAITGVVTLVLYYPLGAVADRHHPLRLLVYAQIAILAYSPVGLLWLFKSFSPEVNYWVVLGLSFPSLPIAVIIGAVGYPMFMRVLPRDRFGQYCSCNALFQCVAGIGASMVAGGYMDLMKRLFPDDVYGKYYSYRFIPVWSILFTGVATCFLVLLYREWKRLGGEKHYTPPVAAESAPATE